jgi:predicted Zn finger-like uncharacterized protein
VAEAPLEPLVTQCPTCKTRFRVTEVQLGMAAGRVRCGACLAVFVGLEHLVLGAGPRLRPGQSADAALDELLDELRHESPKPAREPANDASRGSADEGDNAAQPPPNPAADATDAADDGAMDAATVAGAETAARPAPEVAGADVADERDEEFLEESLEESLEETFDVSTDTVAPAAPPPVAAPRRSATEPKRVRPAPRAELDLGVDVEELVAAPPRRRSRGWVLGLLFICGVALAAQVLYLQFDVWSKHPDIRPVYAWLCERLNCTLPQMRALDALVSKNLVVRANPEVPGALTVDALIVNEATFAQPFPVIELRFSSMGGNLIAGRRFRPDEYLAGEMQGATMMMPRTPVHIALSIDDPGQDAVNYVMVFR